MKISRSKVVIIGSGAVGATTAYSLVVQGVAAEVVLVDLNQEKAGGEALDMQHSMEFQRRNVRVGAGGYEECADADIVVITAAAPMNGEVDRRAALGKSAAIMKSIVPEIMKSGFDGIFLVVSNPVDAMETVRAAVIQSHRYWYDSGNCQIKASDCQIHVHGSQKR